MSKKIKPVNVESEDITINNIKKLKELFPEILTEKKIDFEKLRLILGDEVDDSPERYNFTWNGKKQAMKIAQQPTTATLKPNKVKSKNWDDTRNIYIEGDNLEVLKLLQKSYSNRIKMIYIDPPYNTGQDFIYKDNFYDSMKNYLEQTDQVDGDGNKITTNSETSGRYHTDWLNMMYPRLKLARNLLTEDGVLFASIDENEAANLQKLLSEIFGENNFVSNIIWESRGSISNDQPVSLNHNSTFIYAKSKEKLSWMGELINESEYVNPDNDPRGPWKLVPIDANKAGGATRYEIENPKTGVKYLPPNNRIWAFNFESYKKLFDDGRIKFGMNDDASPKRKLYYKERIAKGDYKTPSSILKNVGTTKNGTTETMKLFGSKVFDYPKPVSFIKKLIQFGAWDNDSIVLDFFSGSGTTAQALMELNKDYGGDRSFILVQIPEKVDNEKYSTIPELAEERIRRAGNKIMSEYPEQNGQLDIGFKVFELSNSNIKKWNSHDANLEDQIEMHLENIKGDTNDFNLVYEIMLKQGLDLSLPIRQIVVGGANVYKVAHGALFIALGSIIKSEVATKIVSIIKDQKLENVSVVIQDTGLINDSEKLNAIEILNAGGVKYDDILSI